MREPDFRCTACNERLRVAASDVARKVRCPRCNEILAVPASLPPIAEELDVPVAEFAQPRDNTRRRNTTLLVMCVFGMLGLVVAGLGAYFALREDPPQQLAAVNTVPPIEAPALVKSPLETPEPAPPKVQLLTPEQVVPRVKSSTVYVRANQGAFGLGTGSGFFAGKPGYVVTNAHVVGYGPFEARPATRVEVVIASGEKGERTLPARIYGVDADTDLALLRVDADELPPPLAFGKAADLIETQDVIIFGYPYGELLGKNISVNRSTISSLRKEGDKVTVVQIAGGLHPGNSGGPITNNRGEVIGVSVSRLRATDTIAFAISPDIASAFAEEQIRVGGRIDTGKLFVAKPDPVELPVEPPAKTPANPVNPTQPAVEGYWKPLRLPPVKPVVIAPAKLDADAVEVKLTSPAVNVCVGGSGQFLILHLIAEKQLAVFNTSFAKVVKSISLVSQKVLFAASAEALIVVYPETRDIERWSLATFEKEATAKLPTLSDIAPIAITLGSASHGPLLVQALDYPRLGERFLLDIATLKVIRGTRTSTGILGALPGNHLRAAPDGRTFTVTAPTQGRSSFLAVTVAAFKEYRSPLVGRTQLPIPSGDGNTILGPGEMADRTGNKVGEAIDPKLKYVWYLPAAHGPLHLSLAEQPKDEANLRATARVSVHASRDPNPLFTLPKFEAIEALCDGPPWTWRFEENVFYCPSAGYIAVLSKDRRRLTLHRVDLDAELAKTNTDYLFVNSCPPQLISQKRFEYLVDARSKKGGLKFRLAPPHVGDMTITPAGLLSWNVPPRYQGTLPVSIVVTDASGRELTHNVELLSTVTPE